jgi:uncharacterized protein YceK
MKKMIIILSVAFLFSGCSWVMNKVIKDYAEDKSGNEVEYRASCVSLENRCNYSYSESVTSDGELVCSCDNREIE